MQARAHNINQLRECVSFTDEEEEATAALPFAELDAPF